MRNIEYYRGRIAKVEGGQEAMSIIDTHRVSSFQGRNGPLSYKLKLIAKKSISYRSELDSPGSSTPLGRWPGEYMCIYIYIYIEKYRFPRSFPKTQRTQIPQTQFCFSFHIRGPKWAPWPHSSMLKHLCLLSVAHGSRGFKVAPTAIKDLEHSWMCTCLHGCRCRFKRS